MKTLILSVPDNNNFGVITGKCVQVPAEESVKKYFLREAVYQRKFKAARKCIYLSH